MKMLAPIPVLAALAALALTGCAASEGAYPSLSVRESERVSGSLAAPPAAPYEAPLVNTAGLDQGDLLVSRAMAAHRTFLNTVPATRNIVRAAQGASRDSEPWSNAQIAIAQLEASRAKVMIALADLDRLTIDAALAGQQFAPLGQRRDEVATLANSQTEVINAMLQSLAR